MPTDLFTSFLLSIIAVGYTPGPANLYALSCAMRHGRARSMRMWLGMLCGFIVMALIASTSAHFAGMALGSYIVYVKYLGAAYLMYLAWSIFRSGVSIEGEAMSKDASCSFLSGFLVQFTNAKMIIYELTVYSTFVLPYSEKLIDLYKVAAWLLIAGPLANLLWLMAGSVMRPLVARYQKIVNTIMAIVLLLCAILIISWSPAL